MAGVLIERGGYLKEILHLLRAETWDCNWLLTGLECYDHCGWPGCEKWAERTLFLSNRELLHDIDLRDMQFVWGILWAVPSHFSQAEVLAVMPEIDAYWESFFEAEILLPAHPLAFLEIACEDSTTVTVVAPEPETLTPLYTLPEWTEDAEQQNRRFNAMCSQVNRLAEERENGQIDMQARRNVYYHLWRSLYHHQPDREIRAAEVEAAFMTLWKGEK